MALLRTDDAALTSSAAGADAHVASLRANASALDHAITSAQSHNIGATGTAFQAAGARVLEALHTLLHDANEAAQVLHTQAASYGSEDLETAAIVGSDFM